MADQPSDLHHQLPEAPPPPKLPPPPLNPPPPPEPRPPPKLPPPIPPPNPPRQPPLPADQPRPAPSNIAKRNATTPAPTPSVNRWLISQTMPPARPPVAKEPSRRPKIARSTPLATTTSTSPKGSRLPMPLLCSHLRS